MRKKQARVRIPTIHPDIAEMLDTGQLRIGIDIIYLGESLGEDESYISTKTCADRLKRALSHGRFTVTGGFQSIPQELNFLDPETEVIFRSGGTDTIMSASAALSYIKNVVERQANNRFELDEIITILAETSGGSKDAIGDQAIKAFCEGELLLYRNGSPVDPENYKNQIELNAPFFGDYSKPENINKWLANWGAEYRFPGTSDPQKEKFIPKSKQQENAILRWLEENDYDPQALPPRHKPSKAKPWVKSEAKAALLSASPSLFTESSFDEAWKRLRGEEKIQDKPKR